MDRQEGENVARKPGKAIDSDHEKLLKRRHAALKRLGSTPSNGSWTGLVFGSSTAAKILGVSVSALRKLVEPVDTAVNPHYRSGPPVSLYDPLDLLRVSKQARTKAARARTTGRSAAATKAAETKESRLIAEVDALPIRVECVPPDELRRRAIEHYNVRRRPDSDRANDFSAADFLLRITVNYVRHELTIYDHALADLWGRAGKIAALYRLRDRVYDEIAKTYPDLAAECDCQRFARYKGDA